MAARILVIQFRLKDRVTAEKQPIARVLECEDCEIEFKNAVTGDIDLEQPEQELTGFDAVILSGSADLYFDGGYEESYEGRVIASRLAEKAKPFARHLIEREIPTLGICFGHQLLGYAAGASVGHSRVESKTGTHLVELTDEGQQDPLMKDVPRHFRAHYGHKDVLFDLPEGAVVLACNEERCRFSALRYADRVYSVQFHPELSCEEIRALVEKYPEYVPDGKSADELFGDSPEAERVLKNFVAFAADS